MAILIKIDGTTEKVINTSLQNLQKLVGGYIEIHSTKDGKLLIVDEEGNLKDKPINQVATNLSFYSRIVGDVVIANPSEIK